MTVSLIWAQVLSGVICMCSEEYLMDRLNTCGASTLWVDGCQKVQIKARGIEMTIVRRELEPGPLGVRRSLLHHVSLSGPRAQQLDSGPYVNTAPSSLLLLRLLYHSLSPPHFCSSLSTHTHPSSLSTTSPAPILLSPSPPCLPLQTSPLSFL